MATNEPSVTAINRTPRTACQDWPLLRREAPVLTSRRHIGTTKRRPVPEVQTDRHRCILDTLRLTQPMRRIGNCVVKSSVDHGASQPTLHRARYLPERGCYRCVARSPCKKLVATTVRCVSSGRTAAVNCRSAPQLGLRKFTVNANRALAIATKETALR